MRTQLKQRSNVRSETYQQTKRSLEHERIGDSSRRN
jgi:hypothetical protein